MLIFLQGWVNDYDHWRTRGLCLYRGRWHLFHIRSDGIKQYILVIIGVASRSNKAFLSIEDGYRESEQSWTEVLLNLKDRGFRSLKLAVGDGALSFWKVERKVLIQTHSQHCWVHETESILNKFQNKVRPKQNNISMISG